MKKLIWVLLTALALLVMTACGTADTEDKTTGDDQKVETNQAEENAVDETETVEEDTATDEKAVEEDTATESEDVIVEEATYVGMADPHTIEVNTETDTIALQILDPGVQDVDFEAIEEEAHVTIEYHKEGEQNILTGIEIH
ncbi:hypothetical protein EKG37_15875 [Robertmurraya yapensis]|uniref:DUF3221 domain-containing protein n=2 Tax=Bacillaceae TaxID=186817 RepID=A0A3S0KEU0_9BACI|nr:hypothetical protein [Bacillus yapensis]RTR29209.1 hypothetical protein EKG37_15875 [Bacillus yapensis]TKS94814.1 hypothetical protein FAR12_15875 [Bacillus yapensis]